MTLEMEFKENADVFDENGEKVGTIDRIVIDPQTKEVTHVVVEEGFLFTEDKVVPVEWLSTATDDRVILKKSEEDMESLPNFEETHFIPWRERDAVETYPPGYAQPYYWYPRVGVDWWGYPGYRAYFGFGEPPYTAVVKRQIPEGTIPLEEGADVVSADNEHVGDVAEIFADPDSGHATHFVISQGVIFKDKKLVPTAWIDSMREDRVYLGVDSDFLDGLESYED